VWFGRYVATFQRNILPQSLGKKSSVCILTACSSGCFSEFVGQSCPRDVMILPLAMIVYDLLITEVKEGMKDIFYVT
jgi:hypothetical protein